MAGRMLAWAACLALLAFGSWAWRRSAVEERGGATSRAVAMLSEAVHATWEPAASAPRVGAPLEPGWLRLGSGLAQITFYSGARVAIEGPAELRIDSGSSAFCRAGRLAAEVPPEARGFRIGTPRMEVTDLGTTFGVEVTERRTAVHVFKGLVEYQAAGGAVRQQLTEGGGVLAEGALAPRAIPADRTVFASLFDLQARSVAAEAVRYEQWRASIAGLRADPSLLVHYDFDHQGPSDWRLRNHGTLEGGVGDATIIGCQWTEGRWRGKPALEFRNVNDRVRLAVPGEYESLTLATWVRVQGLDRTINALFMSDGFEPGTVHWSFRNDGVLALTVFGPKPGDAHIVVSPPLVPVDEFGLWLHLAAVVDGPSRRVTHYVDGTLVSETPLRFPPPYRVGPAELGNWEDRGATGDERLLIRNFSGAMDEFCLFSRALDAREIRQLQAMGRPQAEPAPVR
jgi:hypothetical protein